MKRARVSRRRVPVGLRRPVAERRVVDAADELERQHALGRQRVHDARDDDVVVIGVDAAKEIDGLGLEPVVHLGEKDALDLGERLLGLVAPADGRDHRLEHRETLEVVLDGLVDARVLDLDGDPFAPVGHGAVNLPDAGGGERIALPLGE